MKFKLKAIKQPKIADKDLAIAHKFTDALTKELKLFIKCVVFFGSRVKPSEDKKGDLDILVVFDDLGDRNPDIIKSYILISQKIAKKTSSKIHLTHMPLTEFWDYVRKGDAIIINIIREGVPTFDPGFFQPVQALLRRGKIEPTTESIAFYKHRAPMSMKSANWHMLQASIDLYWAVVDAAHAALMHHHVVPVHPAQVATLLQDTFVAKGILTSKEVNAMQRFFALQQDIHARKVRSISGAQYETLHKEATDFVAKMKTIIELPYKEKQ